jgi:hypothetical protein
MRERILSEYYNAVKYYRNKGYKVYVNRFVTDNLVIDVLAEGNKLRIAIFFPKSICEALHEIVRALEYGYDNAICFMPSKALTEILKERLEISRKEGVSVLEEKGRYDVHFTDEFFRSRRCDDARCESP